MMKILLIVFNWVGKGTYWRALKFAEHLCRRGREVTLLATSQHNRIGIEERIINQVRLVETPDLFTGSLRSGWDMWNVCNRIAWLRNHDFDIVHVFEARPVALFPALYMQRIKHISLVMDWADWFGKGGSVEERPNPIIRNILRPVETFFEEHFRTWADGTTVICTTLQQKATELGVPPNTIVMLPNGCDTERFEVIPHQIARRRLHFPHDMLIIGYMGSIFQHDAELMACAFDIICQQIADVRLLVIGYCPIDIRQLVKKPQYVIQTGFIEDEYLNNHLASCDVCWLPFKNTNANKGRWPLKLNDYMAVGRPTIATAVGDVVSLFETEPIGLLAEDNPMSFAEKSMQLLHDSTLRLEMGTHARHVAETRFSWADLTRRLEDLYQYILKTGTK
ncbi:MAG: hypothetical protein B6242_14615 [Anaerolineaceae bacterium 4572_78]|nr:MAG: hypothetical protein B6242_14615 [Anaerolineaceae bacterium 4572_78]